MRTFDDGVMWGGTERDVVSYPDCQERISQTCFDEMSAGNREKLSDERWDEERRGAEHKELRKTHKQGRE